jgi:FKBP-type peptidyl-prolyl cis-trans isomerase
MKRIWLILLVSALAAAPVTAQTAPAAKAPQSDKEQISYSLGVSIGKSLQQDGFDIQIVDLAMLARGLSDALGSGKLALSEEQIGAALQKLQQTIQAKQQQMVAQSKAQGEAFLAKNAQEDNVKVTPSGLQYKVIKAGSGASPAATDLVRVHYEGKLINGDKFDSSLDRGEPAEFPVNRVIPGWTEALQMMKVGDKWQLFIPANLAYGEQGRPGAIPPNSVLVFEVELLDVKKQ